MSAPREGERYHARMLQLFDGDYGHDIYKSAVIVGDRRREPVSMRAYLTLDPDRSFKFVALTPGPLDIMSARHQVQGLRMHEDDVRLQHTQLQVLQPGTGSEPIEDVIWTIACSRTAPLGLPIAFVGFLSTLQGKPKVVFWYPPMVPGDGMLKIFQRLTRP